MNVLLITMMNHQFNNSEAFLYTTQQYSTFNRQPKIQFNFLCSRLNVYSTIREKLIKNKEHHTMKNRRKTALHHHTHLSHYTVLFVQSTLNLFLKSL